MEQDKKNSEEKAIIYEVLVYNEDRFPSLWEKDGLINKCIHHFSSHLDLKKMYIHLKSYITINFKVNSC